MDEEKKEEEVLVETKCEEDCECHNEEVVIEEEVKEEVL